MEKKNPWENVNFAKCMYVQHCVYQTSFQIKPSNPRDKWLRILMFHFPDLSLVTMTSELSKDSYICEGTAIPTALCFMLKLEIAK